MGELCIIFFLFGAIYNNTILCFYVGFVLLCVCVGEPRGGNWCLRCWSGIEEIEEGKVFVYWVGLVGEGRM